MHSVNPTVRRAHRAGGFTLVEVMVAISVGAIVSLGVMTCFWWCGKQGTTCVKMAWSQDEAMRTCNTLSSFIRNAKSIVTNDINGKWVQLKMADNSLVTLTYSNDTSKLRDGKLILVHTNLTQVIVARGLTAIQTTNGFGPDWFGPGVFDRERDNYLRVAYTVAKPGAGGSDTTNGLAANDGAYSATVRFGVCLRNDAAAN